MNQPADRKLYLGPRLRVLRRELGINQSQMATELGVSPSYLNHLERNQRPLTAQMLVRLANTYDVDIRDFVSGSAKAGADGGLSDALADPLVRDIGIARHEALELAENYPGVAEALVRFHAALTDLRRAPALVDQIADPASPSSPLAWLSAMLAARRNHFAEIETAAEALSEGSAEEPAQRAEQLRAMLAGQFGVTTLIVPQAVLGDTLRFYDFHRRRLMLSERLPVASRNFAVGYQLAAAAFAEIIEEMIGRLNPPDAATRALARIALTNYAAAALLMPYARFAAEAESTRYDPGLLQDRFGVSAEQVAQRLVSLDRLGARGLPFFLIRVDRAGNASKRLAGGGEAIARLGERCPRWRLHNAPHVGWITRMVEMPDGKRYVTLATGLLPAGTPRAGGPVTLVLGTDAKHAARIISADPLAATDPITIGPGCRLCERQDCPDRATPPVTRTLEMSSISRAATPFPFRQI